MPVAWDTPVSPPLLGQSAVDAEEGLAHLPHLGAGGLGQVAPRGSWAGGGAEPCPD